jgi:nondiscriminating aspartyl-tRNA synthetase
MDPEDEKEIAKYIFEKFGTDFLWLLNFKKDKNFYTWNNPDDPDESLSYDLECRGLEWLSGTHRIHIYEKLVENMKKQGLSGDDAKHYLQAFQYGMPSEAGFSFGLERMTKQIFGFNNIREATLFPSDLNRVAGARRKGKENENYE